MSIKLKKYAAVAAFSFVSMLAFNACGEDSEGPQGPAGEQGVAGKNGENGTSCSAKALDDDSGYELTCGGKVVGTIKNGTNGTNGKNGTNGVNGVNGSSCTAKALTDKSGFELSCDGEVVGVIKNGSNGANGINGTNGENGTSCSAKALDDKSGYELICGGEVVGTVKNGSNGENGTSCSAEPLADNSGFELTCGGKVVGTIKNGENGKKGEEGSSCKATALADESGFELSCGGNVVGIIKNGTNGVKGRNGSSCTASALEDGSGFELMCGGESVGIIKNGKDVEKVRGVGFDAWYYGKNSADGFCSPNHRVLSSGITDPDNFADCELVGENVDWNGGWWYMGKSGVTEASWGPNYDEVIEEDPEQGKYFADMYFEVNDDQELVHEGHNIISVKVVQPVPDNYDENVDGEKTENFWMGFNVTPDENNGSDVSSWLGLCLKYKADKPDMRLALLSMEAGEEFESLSYMLPETFGDGDVINIRWSDFSRVNWVPRNEWKTINETVQHLYTIRFYFSLWDDAGEIKFDIEKIGAYGTCED